MKTLRKHLIDSWYTQEDINNLDHDTIEKLREQTKIVRMSWDERLELCI